MLNQFPFLKEQFLESVKLNISNIHTIFKPLRFFRKPYIKFVFNRSGPFDKPITLDRTRVYILPTKSGIIFSILLLVLLIGSVNYDKSLGFILTFLLVGIGNVVLLATWKNLAGLTLSAGGSTPVFAGELATFTVLLTNTDSKTKYAITIDHDGRDHETVDASGETTTAIHFTLKTEHRGYYDPERFRLFTEFPMGLFVSWTIIDLSMSCLVYPTPADSFNPEMANAIEDGSQSFNSRGLEEFTGLKKYQPGESWRRISWKAFAKNNELFTKEFGGGQPQLLWIDWNEIQAPAIEKKLSIMVRLIIEAESNNCHYGLRLENSEIPPDTGSVHYHRCLKRLALYGY